MVDVVNDYEIGTCSINTGSTALTGIGTSWLTSGKIRPGDEWKKNGLAFKILIVNSDTSITLQEPWTGANLVGTTYRIRYQPDGSRYTAAAIDVIELLENGVVEAIANLPWAADKIAFGTGAGTFALTDLKAAARSLLAQVAAVDKFPYFTDANTASLATLTAFARTLLDDPAASDMLRTLGVNGTLGQTTAPIRIRNSTNAVEWGHGNQNGYASVLGHEANTGRPFLALDCEAGTNADTYRTRGIAGSVIRSRGDGGFDFLRIPAINADNQAPTIIASINSSGDLLKGSTKIVDGGVSSTNRYIRFVDGTQICYYEWPPENGDIAFPIAVGATATSGNFPFIASFTTAPYIAYSGYVTDASGTTLNLPILDASVTGGVNFLSQCKWSIRNTSSVAVTRIVFFRFCAVGRWF